MEHGLPVPVRGTIAFAWIVAYRSSLKSTRAIPHRSGPASYNSVATSVTMAPAPTTPPALSQESIAKLAGVSKMSVSRALANKPGISKELREKILKIAREQGYRPNPMVTALMCNLRTQKAGRPEDNGAVLAFIKRGDQINELSSEHFKGASQAALELGYKLESFVVGKLGLEASRLNDVLLARNIHGIIIAPLSEAHGYFNLDWSRFCTVVIGYTFVAPMFDRVIHDGYGSMRIILENCQARGLRKIGLIFSPNERARTEGLTEAAYWMEQKTARFFHAIPPLCIDQWNALSVSKWCDRYKPEAIITSENFDSHLKVFLERHQVHIPNDCSIANVNSFDLTNTSGIYQNNDVIGATAIRLLIDKINHNDVGVPVRPITVLTQGKWVEGKTFKWSANHCSIC